MLHEGLGRHPTGGAQAGCAAPGGRKEAAQEAQDVNNNKMCLDAVDASKGDEEGATARGDQELGHGRHGEGAQLETIAWTSIEVCVVPL